MQVIKEINFDEYLKLYQIAKENFKNVVFNLDTPINDKGTKFFKSSQGCSFLKGGLLGGLFRFKKGSEKIANIHQQNRILKGGYFLECFEGILSDIYKKQGFSIVSRIKFNPLLCAKNWEQNEVLKNCPNVVFMSLYKANNVQTFTDYKKAEKIAIESKKPS